MNKEDLLVDVRCTNPEQRIDILREYELVITHKPTKIKASCGYFKSNHKNRLVCMDMIEYALTNKGIYYE